MFKPFYFILEYLSYWHFYITWFNKTVQGQCAASCTILQDLYKLVFGLIRPYTIIFQVIYDWAVYLRLRLNLNLYLKSHSFLKLKHFCYGEALIYFSNISFINIKPWCSGIQGTQTKTSYSNLLPSLTLIWHIFQTLSASIVTFF